MTSIQVRSSNANTPKHPETPIGLGDGIEVMADNFDRTVMVSMLTA